MNIFKPKDFRKEFEEFDYFEGVARRASDRANEIFNEFLSKQKMVYTGCGLNGAPLDEWVEEVDDLSYRARLVNIEENK